MNAFRQFVSSLQCLVLLAIISLVGLKSYSQSGSMVPVVTVQATQPYATVTHPGLFTLFRAGDTNEALNVWYDLGGTASNGVDYAPISPHLVAIPAGATSNSVLIQPIADPPAGITRTVVLVLTNSPLLNPINYEIGSPNVALIDLLSSTATNLPPSVAILVPENGQVFFTPTNIQLIAKADDPDSPVTNLEFFAGTNDLGTGSPVVLDPPGINGVVGLVYLFTWDNPSPGNYPLSAVASASGGINGTSAPVNISVMIGPPTNPPPVVRIVSPANGADFYAPVNIPIFTFASQSGASVLSVELFAGTNSLGFAQRLPVPLADGAGSPEPVPPIFPINLFFLTWSNPPLGNYALTAEASDTLEATNVSVPVNISVLASPPPPTNRPPVVDIVATDPIAVEGTNCWIWRGETNASPSWASWSTAVGRPFTNCGPETALFTVRRFGDTNGDLTVGYSIWGTASNGVDYVALPGSITIPAGERRAMIPLIPIDDGPPDVNKTVILTLAPSTNTPPDYIPGYPIRAAAIILDNDGPHLPIGILPGGCFHLTLPGPDAAWFYIEYSTNLVNWTTVCTNQVVNGSIDFVDPDAQGNVARFYRALPLINPPAD